MQNRWVFFLCLLMSTMVGGWALAADYYVDAQSGVDTNPGTLGSPWRTIAQVNVAPLSAGDRVLFKRGCEFRGQLVPHSGNGTASVTYGAYGTGAKPKLYGSADYSSSGVWNDEGSNIWSAGHAPSTGAELLPNPSFDADLAQWSLYVDGAAGADATISRTTAVGEYDSGPAGGKVVCGTGSGTAITSLQLSTQPLAVLVDQWYVLEFRAKASSAFALNSIAFVKNASPWTVYADAVSKTDFSITPTWTTYRVYLHANRTANDVLVSLLLGNALPAGATFYLDSLSFKACAYEPLALDVGNLILNSEALCGEKVQLSNSLTAQGRFWYDNDNALLTMFSTGNPGSVYSKIECALNYDLVNINNCSYVIIENLDLRYAGANGINGTNSHHIRIRDCDFSYIGGGQLFGYPSYVRYGNAVQFWEGAHDCWVERCRMDQIYDTGISPQGKAVNQQYNLYFQNNLITNCHWSIEMWNQPAGSSMSHIYVENNTCLNAGYGWSYAQRPDKYPAHLTFFTNQSTTDHLVIRNNVFAHSKLGIVLGDRPSILKSTMDYNLWYQTGSSTLAYIYDLSQTYTTAQFAQFNVDFGANTHAVYADPQLDLQFRPGALSPCVDAGEASPYVTADFILTTRPQGLRTDIGAYETVPLATPTPTVTWVPTQTVTPTSTPGDETYLNGKVVLAFPNPAGDVMRFAVARQEKPTEVGIRIYNTTGERVAELRESVAAATGAVLTWNCAGVAPGLYLVQLTLDGKTSAKLKVAVFKNRK